MATAASNAGSVFSGASPPPPRWANAIVVDPLRNARCTMDVAVRVAVSPYRSQVPAPDSALKSGRWARPSATHTAPTPRLRASALARSLTLALPPMAGIRRSASWVESRPIRLVSSAGSRRRPGVSAKMISSVAPRATAISAASRSPSTLIGPVLGGDRRTDQGSHPGGEEPAEEHRVDSMDAAHVVVVEHLDPAVLVDAQRRSAHARDHAAVEAAEAEGVDSELTEALDDPLVRPAGVGHQEVIH